jgi:uncharacterized membrane protein HdeD (DUF308 family)
MVDARLIAAESTFRLTRATKSPTDAGDTICSRTVEPNDCGGHPDQTSTAHVEDTDHPAFRRFPPTSEERYSMLSSLAHHWWVAVLRGVLAIAFGLAAFVWPGLTLATLIALFGAYALVDGIVTLGLGLFGLGSNEHRWGTILSGALGVLAGIVTFAQPAAAAFGLLYVIAAWAMMIGVLQVAAAVRLREVIWTNCLWAWAGRFRSCSASCSCRRPRRVS